MADKYVTLPPDTNWREQFRVGQVKPSPLDPRDFPALARTEPPVQVPAEYELIELPLRYQGGKGACAVFGVAYAMAYGYYKLGDTSGQDLSEEHMYAYVRQIHDWLCQDTGSYPRDIVEASVKQGWLTEAERPYNDRDLCTPANLFHLADHKASEFRRARNITEVEQIIVQFNVPVTACYSLYDNFFDIKSDGIMPLPGGPSAGGHLMDIVGWRLIGGKKYYKHANWWSTGFGDRGYVWIPAELCDGTITSAQGGIWLDDIWTVLVDTTPTPPVPTTLTFNDAQQAAIQAAQNMRRAWWPTREIGANIVLDAIEARRLQG